MSYRPLGIRLVDIKHRLGIPGFGILERILDPEVISPETEEKLEELLWRYKEGMSKRIGIPPEDISDIIALKWIENYAKAFVTPEKREEFEAKVIKPLREYVKKKHMERYGTTLYGEKVRTPAVATTATPA